MQPIAAFCHHDLRCTQVVAFLLRCGPALAYKLAGAIDAPSNQNAPHREEAP
jgi:hypothetical protein